MVHDLIINSTKLNTSGRHDELIKWQENTRCTEKKELYRLVESCFQVWRPEAWENCSLCQGPDSRRRQKRLVSFWWVENLRVKESEMNHHKKEQHSPNLTLVPLAHRWPTNFSTILPSLSSLLPWCFGCLRPSCMKQMFCALNVHFTLQTKQTGHLH